MTVISAGVVSKQGRIVLARQFTDISRVRIEGLLSAFPRLLESSVNRQVTFIDAGTVRYVYQPIEELFLVLVTTTKSNIVEDLATLHLMGRLILEHVPEGVTEASLEARSFEVFFALDEVVVCGKRENSSVEQIRVYLEMDSYEERMALEEKQRQMEEARKITAEHARKMRERRMNGGGASSGGAYGGISSDDPNFGGFGSSSSAAGGSMNMYAGGGGGMERTYANPSAGVSAHPSASLPPAAAPRSGMSLGKARKADISSKIQKEMGITAPPPSSGAAGDATATAQQAMQLTAPSLAQEAVNITVEEKMSAVLQREGEPAAVDIKGELTVLVADPQQDHIKLVLAPVSDAFTFRAHAKVNKALFASDQVLTMADGKPFPVQQPVTILRWRIANSVITAPIHFTCWPESSSITVEYELADLNTPPLQPVRLVIPLYGAAVQDVQPSTGAYQVVDTQHVVWTIDVVDGHQNASGNIEVTVDSDQGANGEELFFPIQVALASTVSVAHVGVKEVVSTQTGQAVRFSQQSRLVSENLVVQ